jgi:hypothetical protein
MSVGGSQIIFKELLERHHQVQVPMIQRDYAQGRESEQEVRDEFLDALHTALNLPAEDISLPLNLDFIYGSVEGDGKTQFLPLDGQQRLTTLFLLHWYLAWRDKCWGEFKHILCHGASSRFSYSVRPSSTEFFDAFVGYSPDISPDDVDSLSAMLTDQPWYYRYWRLDPTIQSALIMLDAIHLRFKDSKGLFSRITSADRPAITFQLLDLENFGLSDDLYIKMNARGKPLTPFETFKARFEQELKDIFNEETRRIGDQGVSVADFFSQRMDTQWADFFWPYRDSDTNVFDEVIMNLFRTVILVTRSPEKESFLDDINLLRDRRLKSSYSLFHRRGWLDRTFSEMLILLLEVWSQGGGGINLQLPNNRYFDEATVFSKIVSEPESLDYDELVLLLGYTLFLKENVAQFDPLKFQEWMRIVFNLSVNTEYNRPSDLMRSFAGLLSLAPNLNDILQHFSTADKPVVGFSVQQVAEEQSKAQLILANGEWRALIDRAEGHGYFRGQIEFLLDFCGALEEKDSITIENWDSASHARIQEQFKDYLQKAEVMFNERGLRSILDFLWERALLCVGNYLLPRGRNYSFLVNSQTNQASWKRLLRGTGSEVSEAREMLHELWELLDGIDNLDAQLENIIDNASDLDPWIEAFVSTPDAIGYCQQRMIRWNSENEVYLLQKMQMNGTHAELFTYCLYLNVLRRLYENEELKPLKLYPYQSQVGTEIEPGVSLIYEYGEDILRFEIEFSGGKFTIHVLHNQTAPHPVIEKLLLEKLDFEEDGTILIKESAPDQIEGSILMLAEKIGTIQPGQNDD